MVPQSNMWHCKNVAKSWQLLDLRATSDCQGEFQSTGEKRGQQRSLACMWMGMERKRRLCICMFADELEGLRSLSPVWITNPHQGGERPWTEKSRKRQTLGFWVNVVGVCDAVLSEQMSQIGKEKKRRPRGQENPGLNSYLSKSAKYLCGASGRIAPPGCQSKFWGCFQSPFCCGLWGVLATRPRVRRPAGWLQGLSSTCEGLYSSLGRWGETRSHSSSSLSEPSAVASQYAALSRPVTGVRAADVECDVSPRVCN